ncbi:MAG: hypothetical protein AAB303_04255 [Chloroflexota bacterium]
MYHQLSLVLRRGPGCVSDLAPGQTPGKLPHGLPVPAVTQGLQNALVHHLFGVLPLHGPEEPGALVQEALLPCLVQESPHLLMREGAPPPETWERRYP